ncbi:hypothetical protein BDZ89DRAFT_939859 [Hymenopellis radicata]|nr:hypothetical protein BDZ89DRAFT_954397 [Hymenopellis radicata]KAF9051237.1 hypothetical protein BDZ89DRAFT_939859 [Hymenopellis radicata]
MSNRQLLTQSHAAIAAKKRAKRDQIKEITFDDEARLEFLTGFHKRKVAKADAARKRATEREKQMRLEARREQRRLLRERAAENAAQVESAYGGIVGDDDDEWNGISASSKGKHKQQEYEDEEVLATVAVVEDFDPDTLIHGTAPLPSDNANPAPVKSVPRISKSAPTSKPKSKPKKVRYQTKDARKADRSKQHARKLEKAELAGGKASRRKGSAKRGKPRK